MGEYLPIPEQITINVNFGGRVETNSIKWLTSAGESIPLIARIAGAAVATHSVGTSGSIVAPVGTELAFVFI